MRNTRINSKISTCFYKEFLRSSNSKRLLLTPIVFWLLCIYSAYLSMKSCILLDLCALYCALISLDLDLRVCGKPIHTCNNNHNIKYAFFNHENVHRKAYKSFRYDNLIYLHYFVEIIWRWYFHPFLFKIITQLKE